MQSKSLLFGISGFILGGLVVAIAATTFDKPSATQTSRSSEPSMSQMTASLKSKTGDDFDKNFMASMIQHHQSAVAMAKLSESRAKHSEIKTLSASIIAAQEKEIAQMQQWQMQWGYAGGDSGSMQMSH